MTPRGKTKFVRSFVWHKCRAPVIIAVMFTMKAPREGWSVETLNIEFAPDLRRTYMDASYGTLNQGSRQADSDSIFKRSGDFILNFGRA